MFELCYQTAFNIFFELTLSLSLSLSVWLAWFEHGLKRLTTLFYREECFYIPWGHPMPCIHDSPNLKLLCENGMLTILKDGNILALVCKVKGDKAKLDLKSLASIAWWPIWSRRLAIFVEWAYSRINNYGEPNFLELKSNEGNI